MCIILSCIWEFAKEDILNISIIIIIIWLNKINVIYHFGHSVRKNICLCSQKLNLVKFDILGEYFSSTDVPSGKWQIYILKKYIVLKSLWIMEKTKQKCIWSHLHNIFQRSVWDNHSCNCCQRLCRFHYLHKD